MKANEARKTAKEAVQSEIDSINKQIKSKAEKGNTQITICNVSQGAIAYLKDEGYEIQTINFEGIQVIINW